MTSTLTWAARSLAVCIAASGFAHGALAQGASAAAPMDMPASGAKMKKPMKARVTGGPGYVSESAAHAGVRRQHADDHEEARPRDRRPRRDGRHARRHHGEIRAGLARRVHDADLHAS